MSFGLGYVLGQGILGAAMGAGEGVASNADLEQKEQILQLREQRLSQLRTQEHAANTQGDIAAKRADANAQAATDATFYKGTIAPPVTSSASYMDTTGDAQGESDAGSSITTQRDPTRQEQAAYRLEQAKQSGRSELIAQAYKEDQDIRQQGAQDRANTIAANRDVNANRRLDIQQQNADTLQAKVDALLGGGAKTPAKIAEVNALTDMFGGDQEKALAVAYGIKDKPRSDAVLSLSKTLIANSQLDKDGPLKPEEAIARAEQFVDTLRKKDVPTKGGVPMGSDDPGAQLTSEIASQAPAGAAEKPPAAYPNAQKAADGNWYVKRGNSWFRVKQ